MPDQYPQYFPCRGRPQNKCGDPCVWNKNGKCTTKANRKVEALGLRQAKIAAVARGRIARAGIRPPVPVPSGWDMLPDEIRTQILKERTELMRRDRYTPLGAFRPTRADDGILPLDYHEVYHLPRKFFLTIGQVRAIRRGELELRVVPPWDFRTPTVDDYAVSYVLKFDSKMVSGSTRLGGWLESETGSRESFFYPLETRYLEHEKNGIRGGDEDLACTGGGPGRGCSKWVVMTPELIKHVISMRRTPAVRGPEAQGSARARVHGLAWYGP